MKTPKKKARELVELFKPFCVYEIVKVNGRNKYKHIYATRCAITHVDGIIEVIHSDKRANSVFDKEYWQQVRTELEKL